MQKTAPAASSRIKGHRHEAAGHRATRWHDGRLRALRCGIIYVIFGVACVGAAHHSTRSVLDHRERVQAAADIRKAEEKRQGRLVHALSDGHCRMVSIDNASGRLVGASSVMPCDTPMKDLLARARDFSWPNR